MLFVALIMKKTYRSIRVRVCSVWHSACMLMQWLKHGWTQWFYHKWMCPMTTFDLFQNCEASVNGTFCYECIIASRLEWISMWIPRWLIWLPEQNWPINNAYYFKLKVLFTIFTSVCRLVVIMQISKICLKIWFAAVVPCFQAAD